ncbi:MAG TPA: FprA family A-type flavoprotein [Paludibacteraceae bacterium]|nr:FprA family A-type flavoprotein [Paludibacteraceae bacterium]
MFQNKQVAKDIFYVGVNDRQKAKFENIIPLPFGVSYNSYLIIDDKTALMDTVDFHQGEIFVDKIQSQLQGRKLDYLIINHMEPDHSGSIRLIRKYFPEVILVGNSRTLKMIEGFYGEASCVKEIHDEEILSLGTHELQFFLVPMVHWPETMMTFDRTEKVLFSGDAFGCFGALDGAVVDTKMNVGKYWDEMIRYYANIIGKYGSPVQKAIQKLSGVPFETICTTHGPVWKENIQKTINIYDQLSKYEGGNGIVIVYASMYGNTELMAETIAQGVAEAGVKEITIHNASTTDASFILRDIFKYKGLIIGSPTYNNELFPEIEALLQKIELRQVKNRIFGCFGSYTWAGAAVDRLSLFAEKMKWIMVDKGIEEKQALKDNQYKACLQLGLKMGEMLIQSF